ncbi:MAG: glycosyl transferase [Kiritimatiellae bacterium]|nr:glycosyl transferase [Kiritimatiellia bacterium]
MIPKVIHYCWFGKGKLPPLACKCIDSWRRILPEYEIKLWNENNFDVNSCQYTKEAYGAKKFAFVTDYVRLYALFSEGGIYMDSDVEVLRPLDSFLSLPAFTGYETSNGCITGLMGSEKGGVWVGDLLAEYVNRRFVLEDGRLDTTTNVVYTTNLMRRKGAIVDGHKIEMPGYVTIFPQDFFCPKSGASNQISLTENSYVIHHFAGSWVPKGARLAWVVRKKLGIRMGALVYYVLVEPKTLIKKIITWDIGKCVAN